MHGGQKTTYNVWKPKQSSAEKPRSHTCKFPVVRKLQSYKQDIYKKAGAAT
jgi:hypothetical protein